MSEKRLTCIDYVKTVGILAVILGHTIQVTEGTGRGIDFLQTLIYAFHMPLFFMASGWLFHSRINARKEKRLLKSLFHVSWALLIPYAVWGLVYLFFILLSLDMAVFAEQTKRLLTGQGIGVLWFLPTLWLAEVLFLLAEAVSGEGKKQLSVFCVLTVTFLAACVFLHLVSPRVSRHQVFYQYIFVPLCKGLMGFVFLLAGWILAAFADKAGKQRTMASGIILLIVFIAGVALTRNWTDMNTWTFDHISLSFLFGIIGPGSLFFLAAGLPQKPGFLASPGKRSLDFMVLHCPPIPTIGWAATLAGAVFPSKSGLPYVLFTFFLTASIAGIFSHLCLYRAPARLYLKQLGRRIEDLIP